jgi:hypothetical protein
MLISLSVDAAAAGRADHERSTVSQAYATAATPARPSIG